MRLNGLPYSSSLLIFLLFLFAHFAHTAPSPPQQISPLAVRNAPEQSTHGVDIHKRAGSGRHTLANGWVITYRVINVIMPIIGTRMELSTLYNRVLTEGTASRADRALRSPWVTFRFGKVILEFLVEQGYLPQDVGWDIVIAFAEKMLEGELPMTYVCHIAPPWSEAGIQITLSVLV
ncbi:MAG: hypothetical protein Q9224_001459 [Gallowayella concinna]